ncbi:hypothetical protein QF017_005928 [Pseudomonas laurylsulfatiphila]
MKGVIRIGGQVSSDGVVWGGDSGMKFLDCALGWGGDKVGRPLSGFRCQVGCSLIASRLQARR